MIATWQFSNTIRFLGIECKAHQISPQYSTTTLSYLIPIAQTPATQPLDAQPTATSFLGSLLSLIEDEYRFNNLSDSDSIRVCLLLSLEVMFMGHELGFAVDDVFLRMVEDLDVWNDFLWGEHMWRELYGAIRNVTSNHKQEHHKALEKNPNIVLTYSLSGFLLGKGFPRGDAQSEWSSPVEYGGLFGAYLKELSLARTLREKDEEAESGCQTSTKEVSLRDRVKALEGLCDSLMILPKDIKSLKACIYKLETIINCDVRDKYWSDQDGEFFTNIVSPYPLANKDVVNELVDAFYDLVDENDVVQDAGLKVQKLDAEKRVVEQRRLRLQKRLKEENIMKSIYFKDTDVKVFSIVTLKKQNNVLDQFTIERCQNLKDLNRPFKCIDKVYCNSVLEQFLVTSGWGHCKFPWCNEIVMDHSMPLFYATDEIYPLAWRDMEQVFIPRNEPKRHWSLAQFHIQSGNVTFDDSQKTYDVEYHLWYVKMRSCLESKLPVLLHHTSVFTSKGIDPTTYSIKFSYAQNVLK
ncbi:phospholipase-like, aminotransferase-like mobile domain protein [Tanacetum coccineum]